MNAVVEFYETSDVVPIQYERIEACPKCEAHYHVKVEDARSGPRSLQRAFCECGYQIAGQKCLNLSIEKVRAFQR